jgi:hypothetical protein
MMWRALCIASYSQAIAAMPNVLLSPLVPMLMNIVFLVRRCKLTPL